MHKQSLDPSATLPKLDTTLSPSLQEAIPIAAQSQESAHRRAMRSARPPTDAAAASLPVARTHPSAVDDSIILLGTTGSPTDRSCFGVDCNHSHRVHLNFMTPPSPIQTHCAGLATLLLCLVSIPPPLHVCTYVWGTAV